MDINSILQAISDFTGHKWLPLAMLIISYLTAAMGDTSKLPISIPDRWKPLLIVGLGQVYAVLQATSGGIPWQHAVWNGIVASFGAMGLFAIAFKAIWQDKVPRWLQWLTFIDPYLVNAKATVGLDTKLFGFSHPSKFPPPAPGPRETRIPTLPPVNPKPETSKFMVRAKFRIDSIKRTTYGNAIVELNLVRNNDELMILGSDTSLPITIQIYEGNDAGKSAIKQFVLGNYIFMSFSEAPEV